MRDFRSAAGTRRRDAIAWQAAAVTAVVARVSRAGFSQPTPLLDRLASDTDALQSFFAHRLGG